MPKGIPNKRYTPEFKKQVVEAVIQDGLSYQEAARIYEVQGFIKIRNDAKVRGGDLLYDRRDRELYGLKNVSKEVGNPLFFLL